MQFAEPVGDGAGGEGPVLAVIGAGPKAIAIAAKVAALRRAGYRVPRLVLMEKRGVAANWSGAYGYTDGAQPLGTPPEKDVGFPYLASSWGESGASVVAESLRFSWQSYLVGCGHFAEYIDRGKPRPKHRQWAAYLRWVADQVGVEPLAATVTAIDIADAGWRLTCSRDGSPDTIVLDCDGLVITGTGPARRLPVQKADHPRVMDGRTFWLRTERLASLASPVDVCVVGAGETAASIVIKLLDLLKPGSSIEVVTPLGVLYSRGESFSENRLYSNPLPEWPQLAERHRREFLRRTDRGVFSVQAENVLNQAEGVRTLAGWVTNVEVYDADVIVHIAYDEERERVAYDYVIGAIGFDALWFEPLLTEPACDAIRAAVGLEEGAALTSRALEAIGFDLAVEGLRPRLHLPMLAGLAQGPGFPNLACLGLLADRILRPYTMDPRSAAVVTAETVTGRRT